MDDDDTPKAAGHGGAPAWVMTFADLMSLLMCFFVLLLAFSEMDVLKFKQLAGSMKNAFGVQREVKAKEIPKGTSIIAKEFSPGRPDQTALNEVRQYTTRDKQLFVQIEQQGDSEITDQQQGDEGEGPEETDAQGDDSQVRVEQVYVEVEADASALREVFEAEISEGLIEIETDLDRIIIRIQEEGSFPSGSAVLKGGFMPVMTRLSEVLARMKGRLVVAGHTDNVPISTARFRSNWELSAARAVSVLHHLRKTAPGMPEDRFLIEGHADSAPLVDNDTPENRSKNRRVELVIVQSPEDMTFNHQLLQGEPDPGVDDS